MRGEAGQQPKRGNRPTLSLEQKLAAIRRVTINGDSKASVARDLGVPESTLRGWCKSEDKILNMIRNNSSPSESPDSAIDYSPGSGGSTPRTDEEEAPAPKRRRENDESNPVSTPTLKNTINCAAAAAVAAAAVTAANVTLSGSTSAASVNYADIVRNLQSQYKEHYLSRYMLNSMMQTYTSSYQNNPSSVNNSGTVNFVNNGLQYNSNLINNAINCSPLSYITGFGNSPISSARYPVDSLLPCHTPSSSRQQSVSPAAQSPSTLVSSHEENNNSDVQVANENKKPSTMTSHSLLLPNNMIKALEENTLTRPLAEVKTDVLNSVRNSSYSTNNSRKITFAGTSTDAPKEVSRAVLDEILINNVENTKNKGSSQDINIVKNNSEVPSENISENQISFEEAMACGKKFANWMKNTSTNKLTQFEVVQFQNLLNKLEGNGEQEQVVRFKHSRKVKKIN